MTPEAAPATATGITASLAEAIAITPDGERLHAHVHEGWDVFGIPHGGYLAALAGNAVLTATGQPDLFSITTHYLRKAAVGPMRFEVERVGGSRRFTTVTARAWQDDQLVLSVMASVGDRTGIEGPSWTDAPAPALTEAQLSPRAGDPSLPFTPPAVAARLGLRIEAATAGFAVGRTGDQARIRGVLSAPPGDPTDQLLALVACDLTPPAVWNALGVKGWVPTVELTAHVRARPIAGPLTVDVRTSHVADGFLDEDALVYDSAGALVVQSRQLARWTSA
ncbi:thioesterase family protein [soil metagenome]